MAIGTGAAILGGAAISGLLGSKGAKDAANAQGQASAAAIAEERRQYDLNRADLAPYRQAGGAAVNRLSSMMGLGGGGRSIEQIEAELRASGRFGRPPPQFSPVGDGSLAERFRDGVAQSLMGGDGQFDENALKAEARRLYEAEAAANPGGELTRKFTVGDFMDDPVTQLSMKYGLDMGTKAIDRGAGAAGLRNSGATLKALTRFGQDYAGSKANDAYGRFYGDQDRIYNRLAGIAGTGQTATMGTAQLGQQSAQNVGNLLTAQGNARGAASIASGNALGGAFSTIGNYYGQQQTLDKILNRGGVSGSSGLYDIS